MKDTFGSRFKRLRKDRELTQEQVAERMEVKRGTIANWELNRRLPDANTIKRIAAFFNVSMDYLLDVTPDARDMSDFLGKAEMFFMSDNISVKDKDAILRDIMDLYFRGKNGGALIGQHTKESRKDSHNNRHR